MKPIPCPACHQVMSKHRFPRPQVGEVILDLCFSCQAIWFDLHESAQIAPAGVIALFRLIHEQRDTPRLPLPERLQCPRCHERLLSGLDQSRHGGRFNYHRCLQQHGRFTAFSQFMIEKGFVRQLSPPEIHQLAARIGTIRCSGCGAPVDIRHDHACTHCRAPIAILDAEAVDKALNRLHQEDRQRQTLAVDQLAEVILMQEKDRLQRERERSANREVGLGDLLTSGVALIVGLFN